MAQGGNAEEQVIAPCEPSSATSRDATQKRRAGTFAGRTIVFEGAVGIRVPGDDYG